MAEKKAATKKGISFKDKPLVKSGNTFYYGLPTNRFLVQMEAVETKNIGSEEVPTLLNVELLDLEDAKQPKLIMKTERNSLYDALDIGWIWLERAQAEAEV